MRSQAGWRPSCVRHGVPTRRAMRILVVHNAYQQRGGEDSVVAAEVALLRRHGHDHLLGQPFQTGYLLSLPSGHIV